jgi:hypothetical protein
VLASSGVGLARWDEILGDTRTGQKGREDGVAWAGGGEDRPVLDYAARRT